MQLRVKARVEPGVRASALMTSVMVVKPAPTFEYTGVRATLLKSTEVSFIDQLAVPFVGTDTTPTRVRGRDGLDLPLICETMDTTGTSLASMLMVTAAATVRVSSDTVTVSTATEPAMPVGAVGVRVSELVDSPPTSPRGHRSEMVGAVCTHDHEYVSPAFVPNSPNTSAS